MFVKVSIALHPLVYEVGFLQKGFRSDRFSSIGGGDASGEVFLAVNRSQHYETFLVLEMSICEAL